MKNYTQVYVKNSMEAAKTYCKAFGAEITLEMKNSSKTAYEHCELSVNGEGFLAISEAKNPCEYQQRFFTCRHKIFYSLSDPPAYTILINNSGTIFIPW